MCSTLLWPLYNGKCLMSLNRQTFSVMDTHKLLEPFCMQINYNLDKWDFATWILSDMHVANLNVPCDSPVKCWLLCNNLSQITQWATILQFVIMCLYFYANKCTHYVPMKQRIQILFLYFMTKHYIFLCFQSDGWASSKGHHTCKNLATAISICTLSGNLLKLALVLRK